MSQNRPSTHLKLVAPVFRREQSLRMTAVRESLLLVVIAAILLSLPLAPASTDDGDAQLAVAILVLPSAVTHGGTVRVRRHEIHSEFEAPALNHLPLSTPATWNLRPMFASSSANPLSLVPLRC
jgi:hypothetical protein